MWLKLPKRCHKSLPPRTAPSSKLPHRHGQGNEGWEGDEQEGSHEGSHEEDDEEGGHEGHDLDDEEGSQEGDESRGGPQGQEGDEEGSHGGHEQW